MIYSKGFTSVFLTLSYIFVKCATEIQSTADPDGNVISFAVVCYKQKCWKNSNFDPVMEIKSKFKNHQLLQ